MITGIFFTLLFILFAIGYFHWVYINWCGDEKTMKEYDGDLDALYLIVTVLLIVIGGIVAAIYLN